MDNRKLGKKGEKAVVKYLKKNKFDVIYTNFTSITGEVDIIAEKGRYIDFIEVKTRTEGQMLSPMYSVDKKKRRKIISTADVYINRYHIKLQPRFDIAEVIVNDKGKMSINFIKNAFDLENL